MKDLQQFLLEFEPAYEPDHENLAAVAKQSRDTQQPGSIGWLKHDRDYHHHMALGYRLRGKWKIADTHEKAKAISTVKWAAKTSFQGLKAYFNYAGG